MLLRAVLLQKVVHRKYTYKDGKRYGPYYYKTERVNGEIITTYLGSSADGKRKRTFMSRNLTKPHHLWYGRSLSIQKTHKPHTLVCGKPLRVFLILPAAIACVFVLAVFAFLFLAYSASLTGNAALNVQGKYYPGEKLRGSFTLVLEEGELIPATSSVTARLGNIEKTFSLHELLSASNITSLDGNFYARDGSLAGSGTGYGLEGTQIVYPEVAFELELLEDIPSDISGSAVSNDSSDIALTDTNFSEDGANADEPAEPVEPIVGGEAGSDAGSALPESPDLTIPEEEPSNQEEAVSEESPVSTDGNSGSEESSGSAETGGSESSDGASAGITGGVISETDFSIEGRASKGTSFEYELPEGFNARLVVGSVRGAEGEALDDNAIELSVGNGRAFVSTTYKKEIQGFGEEFLGNSRYSISIPLSLFELVVVNETTLSLEASFDGMTFISENTELIIVSNASELSDENLTALLELKNETLVNETFVNQTNQTLVFLGEIPSVYLDDNLTAKLNLSAYFTGALSYTLSASDFDYFFDSEVMTLRANSSFSGARMARIIAESGNEQRLESNEFAIIAGNATLNIQTTRQRIVLGQPVKWIANVTISDGSPVTLQLPAGAENVSVTALDATGSPLVDENVILTSPITGQVIARESDGNSFFGWLTGKVASEIDSGAMPDAGNAPIGTSALSATELILDEQTTHYTVEYYTEPPAFVEVPRSNGKTFMLDAPEDLGYTNVIVVANITNELGIKDASRIR